MPWIFCQELFQRRLHAPTIRTLKVGEFDDRHRGICRAHKWIVIHSDIDGWRGERDSDGVTLSQVTQERLLLLLLFLLLEVGFNAGLDLFQGLPDAVFIGFVERLDLFWRIRGQFWR